MRTSGVKIPPRTQTFVHDRRWCCLGDHFVLGGLVGELEPDAAVDLGFVGGVGVAEDVEDVAERGDDGIDLVLWGFKTLPGPVSWTSMRRVRTR